MKKENKVSVLGIPYDNLNMEDSISTISAWAKAKESRSVCFSNVHSCITANYDDNFLSVLSQSDMVCPDGAPIAWMMRRLGFKNQRRVCGPDLFWSYCKHAELTKESIFLFGSDDETMQLLIHKIHITFPNLKIAGSFVPPFRYINHIEDDKIINMINDSGANTVWVSLGCPKQEVWMVNHTKRINAVLLGVGAAFNFYAGTQERAPVWMRRNGLEWLHRLISEPVRLSKRYFITNTIFILKALKQLLFHRK